MVEQKRIQKINIQQLNNQFGIDKQVDFIEGKGGFPFIRITNEKASALVSIYAAQVLSYKPANETEDFLFISHNAYFQPGKAIKGGIPICWPWFGTAPELESGEQMTRPDHGFVRNNLWSVASVEATDNGDTRIKLEFVDNDNTRVIWPYYFYLSLDIIIGDSLTLTLLTRNTDKQTFFITEALHSYFKVGDASQIQVLGLEKTEYLDKADNFIKVCQIGAITLAEETDHIYRDVKNDLTIHQPIFKRQIKITSSGNNSVVVWNPWSKGSEKITDLGSDDYKHFVCVEIANVANDRVEIQPGQEYKIVTNYRAAAL